MYRPAVSAYSVLCKCKLESLFSIYSKRFIRALCCKIPINDYYCCSVLRKLVKTARGSSTNFLPCCSWGSLLVGRRPIAGYGGRLLRLYRQLNLQTVPYHTVDKYVDLGLIAVAMTVAAGWDTSLAKL